MWIPHLYITMAEKPHLVQREAENYTDPFAVAVMKDDNAKHAATHVHIRSRNFPCEKSKN